MSTGLPSTSSSTPLTAPPDAPNRRVRLSGQRLGARGAVRRHRWQPSPALTGRELLLAALAGVGLAILTTWPLVAHMSSRISPDLGDPVRTAWEIAWVGHAMLHDPTHLFNANAFYPHPLSLAFSDSLLGYGPAAFFGSGTVAALVRYNVLFLFAWSLCFMGAFLLARELGLGRLGAAAAGAAFAYAPYRVTEAGHLHVISSGGIPLALFLLLRGYRRSSRGLVLAGWLVSAWQVSLGFTLGLQYCYLMAVIAVLVVFEWWRGGLASARAGGGAEDETPAAEHPPVTYDAPGASEAPLASGAPAASETPVNGHAEKLSGKRDRGALVPRHLLGVTIVGVLALGAIGVYQARPYLRVSDDYPSAKRTIREVENYSSGPAALLSASSENRVWGSATSGMRAKVHSKNEDVFFPGGLILALALIGLILTRGSPFSPRLRIGLLAGLVVCSVLALGLGLTGAGYPYRLLFNYAPGWNGVRVPGRIFTLATLFYALLAGLGAQLLMARAKLLGARASFPALGAVVGAALLIGIPGEGAGHMAHPVVPQPAAAEIGLPGPLLDLPTDGANDRIWQYFSTDGFYDIPIGNSTFDMPSVDDLRGGMKGFPDQASIEKLRYYGIKTVVLHTERIKDLPGEHGYVIPEPPNPAESAKKPIAGLGVSARHVGSLVIYKIGPGPAALHGHD
jgi:hypothetical protein